MSHNDGSLPLLKISDCRFPSERASRDIICNGRLLRSFKRTKPYMLALSTSPLAINIF